MSLFPLVVRRGRIQDDNAEVKIEVAANDPGAAARLLTEAYREAMAKLGVVLPPTPGAMPPDPHERRFVLDHPAIATHRLTCMAVPEQYEGRLTDGRVFYFRYRSGWARLGLGTDLDAAVFDAMEGPTAEDRAWEYETATAGAFDSDAEASKVFDALLDRHLREDRTGCPST